jgi:SAM-dependent methyltransferase
MAAPSHPHDIPESNFEKALAASPRPDLLRELVETSRRAFGFFTGHYPHTINYPWVVTHLEDLPKQSRILDIGAGVSPVPLALAQRSLHVDCVDSHRIVRTLPADRDWNEWGFFDYRALHENLTAYNYVISDYKPDTALDAIYSISVMAHMPRAVREDALRRCHGWLRPQGRLLLAIDVIPSSDFLWNRCEGQEVEPPIDHGAVSDVLAQLSTLGFQIKESRVVRSVYQSRTDLLFIEAVAGPRSAT